MRVLSYEWLLPVTWQDDGHTIRSIIAEKRVLHANFAALSST